MHFVRGLLPLVPIAAQLHVPEVFHYCKALDFGPTGELSTDFDSKIKLPSSLSIDSPCSLTGQRTRTSRITLSPLADDGEGSSF